MDHLVDTIIDILQHRLDPPVEGHLDAGTTFESLEIDSLVLIELAVVLEGQFGITVTDGELTPELTVAQAAALPDAHLSAPTAARADAAA